MSRWFIGFLLVIIACIPIFVARSSNPELLLDTDTRVLLEAIRERQDPLSWFLGDWPLKNHFYRPISTLTFEFDNWLHGNNAAGYGLSNAALCIACVLLLFWYLRELTDDLVAATAGAILFAAWHRGYILPLLTISWWIGAGALAFGIWRHQRAWKIYVPAFLVWAYVPVELDGIVPLFGRCVAWLPGRTATTMTFFCLAALASYARYERICAKRTLPEPGPLDTPATRSTEVQGATAKAPWLWAIGAVMATLLALGSYEQAVMLPAVLLGTALTLRFRGYQVRFGWQIAFWLCLVAYMLVRWQLVPAAPSGYQLQQFRDGPGVFLSLSDYILPVLGTYPMILAAIDTGLLTLLTKTPYVAMLNIASNLTAAYQAHRAWVYCLHGWACSCLAFLPMAWLQQFEHYHYWPMAMRSLLVIGLITVAGRLFIRAVSPPTRQAPPRLDPAPGSLPRP